MKSLIFILLLPTLSYADSEASHSGSSSGSNSYVGQTQQRRSSERFDLIGFLSNQKKVIAEQNSRLGAGKSGWGIDPDFTLYARQDAGDLSRDGVKLGKLTEQLGRATFYFNNLFSSGNKKRALNIDIGFEYYMAQTAKFERDPLASQTDLTYQESGGAILFRPFGRSSQDTNLSVRVGSLSRKEKGMWSNTLTENTLSATYLGAYTKLYLTSFMGIHADYQSALESNVDSLASKWKMSRFLYGAFLEIYLLHLEAHIITSENVLTPNSSTIGVKELTTSSGLSAALYF